MASIHGTVSTILAVQISAPCSPCMNCDSVQFCDSQPSSIHSLSPHLAKGVPDMSISCVNTPPLASELAITTASWSTSMSQGRSVSPFHWFFLAFS